MSGVRAPKGTFDVLPPEGESLIQLRDLLATPVRRAGYAYMETPVFEETDLFVRGVGGSSDVVSKEMYSFTTKGGDEVTLRPEGTASVVRAAVQHGLHRGALPVKVWYSGPFFRYERPQAGRFRHFSQVGAEALGTEDPAVDAELIALAADAFTNLGLTRVRLLLNSLGDSSDRPAYRQALVAFLQGLDLDEATRQRVELNPLRVLDDKRPEVQAQLADVPLLPDYLSDDSRHHYDEVRQYLTDIGIAWEEAPRLVRGLDYYTRTAFEFIHDGLGAQSAIGGGGRYDGLSEAIGGPPLPSVGFALGVERTALAVAAEGLSVGAGPVCAVFGVGLSAAAHREVFEHVTALRRAGISTDLAPAGRGLKGSMKAADRSGARLTLIVGDRDLAEGLVQIKNMSTGEQQACARAAVVTTIQEALA